MNLNFIMFTWFNILATNVLGLCEGGELEVQMFILAQMLIRIPNVQI
jgi:hypothetical protein